MSKDTNPHEDDTESQANVAANVPVSNEETPLLSGHSPDHEEEEDVIIPEQRKRSWYIWRGLWVIAGALVLAFFIKGLVDSHGDVKVGDHDSRLKLFG